MTHRTNEIALLRLKIPPPLSLLHGTAAGLLRTLESRQAQLFSHDLAHLIDWNAFANIDGPTDTNAGHHFL